MEFPCIDCKERVNTDLLNGYNDLEDLIAVNDMSKESVVKQGMAQLRKKIYAYSGLFIVYNNLPAYYKIFLCNNCKNKHIAVFGFGESQPGRNLLYISGVWKIK
ncbi:MAG TPA: hypothetical protein DIT04_02720 [Dysgonomonas sp.]|nr:hypothetical protein [Dysgonomonas sp.]